MGCWPSYSEGSPEQNAQAAEGELWVGGYTCQALKAAFFNKDSSCMDVDGVAKCLTHSQFISGLADLMRKDKTFFENLFGSDEETASQTVAREAFEKQRDMLFASMKITEAEEGKEATYDFNKTMSLFFLMSKDEGEETFKALTQLWFTTANITKAQAAASYARITDALFAWSYISGFPTVETIAQAKKKMAPVYKGIQLKTTEIITKMFEKKATLTRAEYILANTDYSTDIWNISVFRHHLYEGFFDECQELL